MREFIEFIGLIGLLAIPCAVILHIWKILSKDMKNK